MTHDAIDHELDRSLGRFLEPGPERASTELVEATFRPIPLMRQQRRWRLRVAGSLGGSRPRVVGVAAVVIVLIVGGVSFGAWRLGGIVGGPPAPVSSPTPAPSVPPSFTIDVSGSRAASYDAVADAGLSLCHTPDTGPWTFQYGGGSPFASIDLVLPDGAATAIGSDRVAAEIEIGNGTPDAFYVRFDPSQVRGGDPTGRSQASVEVSTSSKDATVVIHATTPDRTSGADGPPVTIDMTLECPR